ncbi:hypothetical protein GCM10027290_11150 [Micromonospora sonneratiae]|uniref:DUF4232 domain-containing protein n=1 Tax=Micromonospora sonneratiae TaxID=1184706 RepID=A0ABW3YKM2_9ACTN
MTALATACTSPPGPAPGPEPVPSATSSASPACPQSGVLITNGMVDTAMGLRAMTVEMINCGGQSYAVQGYPMVRVLDEDRNPLPVKVIDGTSSIAVIKGLDAPPKPVTLLPGQRAKAVLVWRNTVTDATVSPTTGKDLEITPAGGQSPQIVSPNGGVDLGTTGRLGVSPWAPLQED